MTSDERCAHCGRSRLDTVPHPCGCHPYWLTDLWLRLESFVLRDAPARLGFKEASSTSDPKAPSLGVAINRPTILILLLSVPADYLVHLLTGFHLLYLVLFILLLCALPVLMLAEALNAIAPSLSSYAVILALYIYAQLLIGLSALRGPAWYLNLIVLILIVAASCWGWVNLFSTS